MHFELLDEIFHDVGITIVLRGIVRLDALWYFSSVIHPRMKV